MHYCVNGWSFNFISQVISVEMTPVWMVHHLNDLQLHGVGVHFQFSHYNAGCYFASHKSSRITGNRYRFFVIIPGVVFAIIHLARWKYTASVFLCGFHYGLCGFGYGAGERRCCCLWLPSHYLASHLLWLQLIRNMSRQPSVSSSTFLTCHHGEDISCLLSGPFSGHLLVGLFVCLFVCMLCAQMWSVKVMSLPPSHSSSFNSSLHPPSFIRYPLHSLIRYFPFFITLPLSCLPPPCPASFPMSCLPSHLFYSTSPLIQWLSLFHLLPLIPTPSPCVPPSTHYCTQSLSSVCPSPSWVMLPPSPSPSPSPLCLSLSLTNSFDSHFTPRRVPWESRALFCYCLLIGQYPSEYCGNGAAFWKHHICLLVCSWQNLLWIFAFFETY